MRARRKVPTGTRSRRGADWTVPLGTHPRERRIIAAGMKARKRNLSRAGNPYGAVRGGRPGKGGSFLARYAACWDKGWIEGG